VQPPAIVASEKCISLRAGRIFQHFRHGKWCPQYNPQLDVSPSESPFLGRISNGSLPRQRSLRHFDKRPRERRSNALATITFGAKSAEQVIAGKKTVTFRKWPNARVKAGEVYDAARVGYPPQKFARIRVTLLRRIRLKEIDDKLARKDGASSSTEAKAYWSKQGLRADDELWLVEFELVRK